MELSPSGRPLEQFQRDDIVNAEIGAASPCVWSSVDGDRTIPADRPRPAGHGALPGKIDVVDRQAEMHVSRIWRRLRIGLSVRVS